MSSNFFIRAFSISLSSSLLANALLTRLQVLSKLLEATRLVVVVSRLLLVGCWLVVVLRLQVVSMSKLLEATRLVEAVPWLLMVGCWLVVVLWVQVVFMWLLVTKLLEFSSKQEWLSTWK